MSAAEAWLEWHNSHIPLLWELEGRERDETIFTEGYRRALLDAADDAKTYRWAHTAEWLRARTAAVAPRETKD